MAGAPIPTLGYRSKTDAVMALAAEGMSMPKIARRLGIPTYQAHNLARDARRRRGEMQPVRVPHATLGALQPFAQARGTKVDALIRALLQAIVDDEMVDAVLDDQGDE